MIWQSMLMPAADGVSQQIGHIQACDGMNKPENRSAYIALHFQCIMKLHHCIVALPKARPALYGQT